MKKQEKEEKQDYLSSQSYALRPFSKGNLPAYVFIVWYLFSNIQKMVFMFKKFLIKFILIKFYVIYVKIDHDTHIGPTSLIKI